MKNGTRFVLCNSALIITALLFAACASTAPSQFYSLSALDRVEKGSSDLAVGEKVAVGIGPVEFPELLNKPQIVTRASSHRLNVDEFHRWGSPLDEEFTRVLADNVAMLLDTERLVVFPWESFFKPNYRVLMDVQQLDGSLGGGVTLRARWTLLGENGNELTMRRSVIEEQTSGGGYEALVSAKSRAIATLSREIATEIHKVETETTGK